MRRREFITLFGGAVLWPRSARAQQPGKQPAEAKRVAAFVGRLRELSWIEGRTVAIEYRWTEGRGDLAADMSLTSRTCQIKKNCCLEVPK